MNQNVGLVTGCGEMPLMRPGARPRTTGAFSWQMDIYRVTSFNAGPRGDHTSAYYLTSSDDVTESSAT
ncbi:MAG TPA: hypothetical protein PLX08_07400 [Bacteroidales bacterium]|nr:hypothetical protein [Bacteroidales bacterium]